MGNLPGFGGLQHVIEVRECDDSSHRTSIDAKNSSYDDQVKEYSVGLTPRRSTEFQVTLGSSVVKSSIADIDGTVVDPSKNVQMHKNSYAHPVGSNLKGISLKNYMIFIFITSTLYR